MPEFKFNLGDVLEDTITGFDGVLVMRAQWINNCNTYALKSRILKDGLPTDMQYFDEPQLKLIDPKTIESSRKTGGPERRIPQANR